MNFVIRSHRETGRVTYQASHLKRGRVKEVPMSATCSGNRPRTAQSTSQPCRGSRFAKAQLVFRDFSHTARPISQAENAGSIPVARSQSFPSSKAFFETSVF